MGNNVDVDKFSHGVAFAMPADDPEEGILLYVFHMALFEQKPSEEAIENLKQEVKKDYHPDLAWEKILVFVDPPLPLVKMFQEKLPQKLNFDG